MKIKSVKLKNMGLRIVFEKERDCYELTSSERARPELYSEFKKLSGCFEEITGISLGRFGKVETISVEARFDGELISAQLSATMTSETTPDEIILKAPQKKFDQIKEGKMVINAALSERSQEIIRNVAEEAAKFASGQRAQGDLNFEEQAKKAEAKATIRSIKAHKEAMGEEDIPEVKNA